MKKLSKYRQYFLYHAKWQASIVVSWPAIWFFKDYLGWSTFTTSIAFQFIGAVIFWYIDQWIFKK